MSKICSILGMGSLSALGASEQEITKNLYSEKTFISKLSQAHKPVWVASLEAKAQEELLLFLDRSPNGYKRLDRKLCSLSMIAAEKAFKQAQWEPQEPIGINIGSSRGATHTFEKCFDYFSKDPQKKAQILSSPTTTLGNIAYWSAQHIQSTGMAFSHSITCSSALQAILNAAAWLWDFVKNLLLGGQKPLLLLSP